MAGRLRSVLLNLDVRPAGRACRCKHDARHEITKGELRLVVKEPGPASGEHGYCVPCGLAMLARARTSLAEHVESLGGQAPEPESP